MYYLHYLSGGYEGMPFIWGRWLVCSVEQSLSLKINFPFILFTIDLQYIMYVYMHMRYGEYEFLVYMYTNQFVCLYALLCLFKFHINSLACMRTYC